MNEPVITFILNSKTYSLHAGDLAAISAIPQAERQQLIALLEAVKLQEQRAADLVQGAVEKTRLTAPGGTGAKYSGAYEVKPERMGSGDVDAIMARLVMEENRNRKPGPRKQDLYKWILGSAVVLILVLLVFS